MPVICLSYAFYRLLHRDNRREDMLMREDRIPIWEKYTLSVEEAAVYFRIGEAKLRRLISENADADYILCK